MGEAQRLGPVAAQGRPAKESDGIALRAPDRARAQRHAGGRHTKQPMGPEQSEASGGVAREPLGERGTDPLEVGRPSGDRHDGQAEATMERVQVKYVEPTEHGPVDQDGPHAVERAGGPDDRHRLSGRVAAVDLDRAGAHRLDVPR